MSSIYMILPKYSARFVFPWEKEHQYYLFFFVFQGLGTAFLYLLGVFIQYNETKGSCCVVIYIFGFVCVLWPIFTVVPGCKMKILTKMIPVY
jgi:hypothetical protein